MQIFLRKPPVRAVLFACLSLATRKEASASWSCELSRVGTKAIARIECYGSYDGYPPAWLMGRTSTY